ncbi:MAG: transglutaminase domain-containing protein [Nanoarchaeota archaeon]|nr:transglutaminase domain-containing protein [Nanoarchaeota archaeon]
MLRSFFFLFTLVFFSSAVFCADSVNSQEYLKLKIENSLSFGVNMEADSTISLFQVRSNIFPQTYNDSQYLNDFQTSYNGYKVINESSNFYLLYSFEKEDLRENNLIQNDFILESTVSRPKIRTKVLYPVSFVSEENREYLGFKEFIDVNEDIRRQASLLADGEDDLFVLTSKVAKWIREDINYNLSTALENPNQTSTQVFKSKSGVCREITNLFLSMMRSLGVPARVVTGYAYTDSEEIVTYVGSHWGGHAWAEVFIGDEWVPFDLTYNQYGYVDATHIILDKSAYLRTSSASINASGYGFSLKPQSLHNDIDTIEILEKREQLYDSGYKTTIFATQSLGFDSYGYVKLTVKNMDAFYKLLFIRLSKVKDVELLDSAEKMVIFLPNEEKDLYFRFKIPSDLDEHYIYTYPFAVYNEFFEEKIDVTVSPEFLRMKEIALPEIKNETKSFSDKSLEFSCEYYYGFENNTLVCSVRNTNNFEIPSFLFCTADKSDCTNTDLKINEVKTLSLRSKQDNETLIYEYKTPQKGKQSGSFEVLLKEPTLSLSQKEENGFYLVEYDIDNYVDGLMVSVFHNGVFVESSSLRANSFSFPLVDGNNTISLVMEHSGSTIFEMQNVTYYHKEEIEQETNKTLSFWESIVLFFKSFFSWI